MRSPGLDRWGVTPPRGERPGELRIEMESEQPGGDSAADIADDADWYLRQTEVPQPANPGRFYSRRMRVSVAMPWQLRAKGPHRSQPGAPASETGRTTCGAWGVGREKPNKGIAGRAGGWIYRLSVL